MPKLTLPEFTSIGNETSFLNSLNQAMTDIEDAIENTVSRDGTTPNDMSADLDLGDNDILNVANINVEGGGESGLVGQINNYTTAERDALVINAGVYLIIYNTDDIELQFWNGSTWLTVVAF